MAQYPDTLYAVRKIFAAVAARPTTFPDPVFAGGEIGPAPAGLLDASRTTRRDGPTRQLLLCRAMTIKPFGLWTDNPVGQDARQNEECLDTHGGGLEPASQLLSRITNVYNIPAGQTGAQRAAGTARRSRPSTT